MIIQAPIERIKRSQIDFASYNPRRISEDNKARLKKSLKEFGMVEVPVWNRRSGRLVGAHQRIEIMDADARGQDYEIDVKVVDLDDAKEARLNIILNNSSAMGEFDTQAVQLLSKEFEFDLSDAGFSREDLYINFEFDKPLAPEKSPEEKQEIKEKRDLQKQEYREEMAQGLGQDGATTKQDYTLQIVFPNNLQAHEFLRHHGLDATKRYFPADLFLEAIGIQ